MHLREGKPRVDDRIDRARREPAGQLPEVVTRGFDHHQALLQVAPACQPVPDDAPERRHRADEHASSGKGVPHPCRSEVAEDLEDHVERAAQSGPRLCCIIERLRGPEVPAQIEGALARRGGDLGPELPRHLDGQRTDTAGSAMHQHPSPLVHLAEVAQRLERLQARERRRGPGFVRHRVREHGRRFLLHDDPLRQCAGKSRTASRSMGP